jgi:inner membrane protein
VRRKAHLVMGSGLALAAAGSDAGSLLPVLLMGAIGSIMPDLDILYKHRKLLHNIFAAALFTGLVMVLLGRLDLQAGDIRLYSLAYMVGWLSHLLGDMVTRSGVALLWPFSNRRFRVARMRYDDPRTSLIGYIIGIIGVLAWLARSPYAPILREALGHAP